MLEMETININEGPMAEAAAIQARVEEVRRNSEGRLYFTLKANADGEGWTATPKLSAYNVRFSPGMADPDNDPDAGEGLATSFWRPFPAIVIGRKLKAAHPGVTVFCWHPQSNSWLWCC